MRVTLLGTGTPNVDPDRQQSALIIDLGDHKILVDAGRGVTSQLARAGYSPAQIDTVLITHHHYDHISDLGEFFLSAWHNGRETPTQVYGPPGTRAIVAALFEQVFARDIAFALFTNPDTPDIRNLVVVEDVLPGLVINNAVWQAYAEYVDHGNSLGLSREDFPCFGYRIEADSKVLAISGDTVACEGLDRLAQEADCLVQCCYLAEAEITMLNAERSAKYIIASSKQAGEIAARNLVKKLVLTHFRPKSAELMQSIVTDVRAVYSGETILGEDLLVVEV
jgi:ribonuclease BN (tRNA processing enzyme)